MGKTLEASTTTGLERTTVHQQYNRKAFGVFFFGRLVPIVLTIKTPGNVYTPSVLMFGNRLHEHSPYVDLGVAEICCRQVFTFNVQHYLKCYLPNRIAPSGEILTPYTYNLCQWCGATIQDSNGHTVSTIMKREFRRNRYVWATDSALQDAAGPDEIFTFQREVTE